MNDKDKTWEVIKFAVPLGISLIAFTVGYGSMTNRVSELEKDVTTLQAEVKSVREHNQQQDLETVRFRTEMKARVQNIEALTQEIHTAIVGD
jgi:regulator of replication initiation timing